MIYGVKEFVSDGVVFKMKTAPSFYWKLGFTAKYAYDTWWPIFKDENELLGFIEAPVKIVYWREALRVGQWIEADNGNIGYIIKSRNLYKNREGYKTKTIFTTSFGDIYENYFVRKDFELYDVRSIKTKANTMLLLNGRRPIARRYMRIDEYLSQMTRLSKQHRSFLDAVMIIIATNPTLLSQKLIVELYEKNIAPSKHGKSRVLSYAWALMGNKRARSYMSDVIKKKAKAIGIDDDFVLNGIKKIAENSNSDKVKLESFIELGNIIGTYDKEPAPGGGEKGFVAGVLIGAGNQAQLGQPEPEQLTPADDVSDEDFGD